MQTYEEQKALVAELNVIDDVFFQKIAEDMEVVEEFLRIILERPGLKVVESQTQRFLRNTGARSVILDLLCEDENRTRFSVEVQKTDDDDHQKRVRFIQSNIDTVFTEKGIPYENMPEVYIIYISRFDVFKENHTIYHVRRVIEETGTVVENGTHELYVNAAVDDKSDIAELMQYFKKSVGEHQNFQKLCSRVKYFREAQRGVSSMNQVLEEYFKQRMQERDVQIATNLLNNGISVDMVAKSIPSLTYDFIVELSKKVLSPSAT